MKLDKLGNRDDWTCWICSNGVDPDAVAGSAHAASIDHVIPRAAGGRTTDDNLRLAHRKCNTGRGSALPELSWPTYDSMIDSTPLWPAIKRLSKRPGSAEKVAFFSRPEDADRASTWAVSVATTVTGLGWTCEVTDDSSVHGVKLQANRP